MIKRNSMIALGSILAVAGCSTGGHSSSNPAVPAAKVNRPLTTGHLTINPSLLKHAAGSRRRPSFVDGLGNGGTLTLEVSSFATDGSGLSTPVTIIPLSAAPGPVSVAIPLYGPFGFVHVQEFTSSEGSHQLLADDDFTNYNVTSGVDTNLSVTLQAVLGGFVLSDKPDGSSSFPNTQFEPLAGGSATAYAAPSSAAFTLFAFPADAAGNFSPISVPGGFANPVTVSPLNNFGDVRALSTNIPGVFNVCNASGTFAPETDTFIFTTSDALSGQQSLKVQVSAGGGYLATCPNGPTLAWTTQAPDPRFSPINAPVEGGGPFLQFLSTNDAPASLVLVDTGPPLTPFYNITSTCPSSAISPIFPQFGVSASLAQPFVVAPVGPLTPSFCQITATDNRTPVAQTATLFIFINNLTGTIH